ncbi:MAG: histidinol-phosphate transaminase [Actinomycetota bacterium]
MTAEPRPGIRDTGPYVSPQLDVPARLNTNECPFPLPEDFSRDLARAVADIPLNRYPEGQATRLREDLADFAGHIPEGTWAANGSNEVLTQLLLAYGGPERSALVFEPTYPLHSRLSWLTHTRVERGELGGGFTLGDEEIARAVAVTPDVIFVCSPNNPTGNVQSPASVRTLAEAVPEALVIVDEAYIEFGGESALPLVASHPNVVVVRTLSKAFALAGVRLGYCLADPKVVDDLRVVRLPYHLSSLTQAAGITALQHVAEATSMLGAVRRERDRIVEVLSGFEGVTVFPSDANFVLFAPPDGCDARELWQRLLDRGVLVRDLTSSIPQGLRVTAGAPHEVDLFLKVMEEVL